MVVDVGYFTPWQSIGESLSNPVAKIDETSFDNDLLQCFITKWKTWLLQTLLFQLRKTG